MWKATTGHELGRRRTMLAILSVVAVPEDSALVAFLEGGLALVLGSEGAWWLAPGREPVRAALGVA